MLRFARIIASRLPSRHRALTLAASCAAVLAVILVALHGPAGAAGIRTRQQPRSTGPAQHHRRDRPAVHGADMRRRQDGAARAVPAGTSCRSVAHIGDSTSVGMVAADVLPDPAQRLPAQYAAIGIRRALIDASGGRSIVETLPGQVNGYNVAQNWAAHGYRGCWVIALGTNDTANVSVGSSVDRLARIERIMSVAAGAPTMWVNVRTLLSSGPWSEANMQAWNQTLLAACAQYPNMRIFDWADVAQPAWFGPDGIHYTPAGYAARASAVAAALARAFPRHGHSQGCVVR